MEKTIPVGDKPSIKFADQIVKEMDERGTPIVLDNCVTGEEFEKWLRERPFREKIANAKPSTWLTDGLTQEEVKQAIKKAKEQRSILNEQTTDKEKR